MGQSIAANLISWAIIVTITLVLATYRTLLARLWLEAWLRIYPDTADALRSQYADEIDIDDHLKAIGRALLFAVNVPRMARAISEAEKNSKTRTAQPSLHLVQLAGVVEGKTMISAQLAIERPYVIDGTVITVRLVGDAIEGAGVQYLPEMLARRKRDVEGRGLSFTALEFNGKGLRWTEG